MPNIVEIVVEAVDHTKKGFEESKKGSKSFEDTMGKAGLVAGAALIAVGAKAVSMASEFQASTTRLATSAGESYSSIKLVGQGMLDMAGQVGISAKALSDGMYTVESAGYHGADGLIVLKAAAEGAKDENADLATVSNAVTDALVDYHMKASDAGDVTSKLVTAVSFGKTSFQDLGASMHSVLPLASAMHLDLSDVLGVLGEMTAHGISADQATQNMANTMRHLAAPSKTMIAEFKKLGTSIEEVQGHLTSQGLSGALEFMSQTALKAGKEGTPAYTAALAKLLGTAQGLNVTLMTTGENAKATQAAIAGISKASADAKGNVAGFGETQATLKQQEDELKASFGSLMIELGQKLLPILTTATAYMAAHGSAVTKVAEGLGIMLAAMAAWKVAAMVASAATKAWTAMQWLLNVALDANPIGLTIIAVAALSAAIYLLWTHSAGFRDFFIGMWKAIKSFGLTTGHWFAGPFTDFFVGAFNAIKSFGLTTGHWFAGPFANFFKSAYHIVLSAWDGLVGGIKAGFNGIVSAAKVIGHAIADPFIGAFNAVKRAWNATLGGKGLSIPGWVPGLGGDSFTIPRFAHGGNTSGLFLAGENGPELVDTRAGRVRSAPDTARVMSSEASRDSGAHTLVIQSSGSRVDDLIVEILRTAARTKAGGSVATLINRPGVA